MEQYCLNKLTMVSLYLVDSINPMLMKATAIRFFSPQENQLPNHKKENATQPKKIILTGYISTSGKLVFPAKAVAELGIDTENNTFKVGVPQGKRKAKLLYLVPAENGQDDTFQLEKAAKSYTLSLGVILKKSGVDFTQSKYSFTIELFNYDGNTAMELQLRQQEEAAPKAAYTGKPRGRKSKEKAVVE